MTMTDQRNQNQPDVLPREDAPAATRMLPDVANMVRDMRADKGSMIPIDREDAALDAPLELPEDKAKGLIARLTNDELDVKPDRTGAVYLSHTSCRTRLNAAFGPFGWRILPVGDMFIDRTNPKEQILYRQYQLMVAASVDGVRRWHHGPSAWGEQIYLGTVNRNFTWGDALEGCQSIGLARICKAIGMAVDRRTSDRFKQQACIKVFVEEKPDSDQRAGKMSTAWRRIDAPPLFGETGICQDSPNKKDYIQPPAPYWRKNKQAAGPQAAAQTDEPTTQVQQAPPRKTISKAQGDALWREVTKQGMADDEVATVIAQRWGAVRTSDIAVADYPAILAWVKKGGD
jgi:hypothetical protein